MSMTIRSEIFAQGAPIPKRYTGDDKDVSPKLSWEGVPPATKELALICDDAMEGHVLAQAELVGTYQR